MVKFRRVWTWPFGNASWVLILVCAMVASAASGWASERAAVVLGNGAYALQPAATPVQDARLVSDTLREMGFDVLLAENVDASGLARLPDVAARHLGDAKIRVVYIAGYFAVQKADNAILPVDLRAGADDALWAQGLSLRALTARLQASSPDGLVMVADALRSRPGSVPGFGSTGLALPEGDTPGTLVALCTSPGSAATTASSDANGIYATALVNALGQPGAAIHEVFRNVRRVVREATGGAQLPVVTGGQNLTFALRPPAPADDAPDTSVSLDSILWSYVRGSADDHALATFVDAFPLSPFAERAQARRVRLAGSTEPGIGTLTRQLGGGKGADAVRQTGDRVLATTGDRTPPIPLRTWPDRLPDTPDGLGALTADCDRLAADPDDPMRVAPGVKWGGVNQRAAIQACVVALAKDPSNARWAFQLGRALDAAGRFDWATTYYNQAAVRAYGAAYANLAYMAFTARGRTLDMPDALRLMRLGAALGNPRSRTDLAMMYMRGQGVPKSTEEGVLWLRLAGANGWPNAIDVLGSAMAAGDGMRKNPAAAAELFETAAWIGNTNAMQNLGRAYLDGVGVTKDLDLGRRWLERSAAAGNPFAPFFLAQLYVWGKGVPKDMKRAVTLYQQSADRGFGQARFELGEIYRTGGPVAADPAAAAVSYGLAQHETFETPVAPSVRDSAKARYDDVTRSLTATERAAVDKRIRDWIELNG